MLLRVRGQVRAVGRVTFDAAHRPGPEAVAEVVAPAAVPAQRVASAQPLKVGAVGRELARARSSSSDADKAARIEQTLNAVQSGSYCRSPEAPPRLATALHSGAVARK